ncbi:MAG: A/G-specific adenine glycosylase [Candidatus Hydrogenedentes bacterium]|nr:A/G-specific adenine glycosylase [Candidatus Hydrogenedentota bacterium]
MRNPRALRERLLAWFQAEARDLPFRGTTDPYAVWVSEIILQQTRVDQGTPYYNRFVAAFPTVEALAAAPEEAVLKLWEGLGYYSRARNLHAAARMVCEQHGGRFPETAAQLRMLPGIGPYTAAAVASIAFGERVAVLDGNVKRVLARLFALDDCIDDPATERELWRLAQTLVPPRGPGDFNQAMMELGARVCTPRAPACMACPVASECRAHAEGREAELPVRKPKAATPLHEIVTAVIERDGCFLVGRRPHGGMLGGLWEFPGGKVEKGEDHALALARECREELGVEVCAGGLVACVRHAYTHFRIVMSVYRCAITAGEPAALAHTELRWVSPEAFDTLAFPKANHKFLPLLRGDAEQEGPCSRGVSK